MLLIVPMLEIVHLVRASSQYANRHMARIVFI
jgi:hypothetical protein